MEKPILELNHLTDEATKQMLIKCVEKKRKFDKLDTQLKFVTWLSIFITFFITYYFYKTIYVPYSYSFDALFTAFVSKKINGYILLILIGFFCYMKVLKDQKEKAEKEFDELRREIIDKSKDLWKKDEAWETRHIVFEMMKREYDINLYHESK